MGKVYTSEYFDEILHKSDAEKKIDEEIHNKMEEFENSEAHKQYRAELDVLFKKESALKAERWENAKKKRPERKPIKTKSKEEMDEWRKKAREEKEARINELPENLKNAIKAFESLTDEEKTVFAKETYTYTKPDLDDYSKRQITHEQTIDLHEVLVQTCIDYINEHGLKDVDAVYFSADALQESSRFGEWTPSTDSFLTLEGMEKSKEDGGFYVRKFIDKSY